MTEMNRSQTSLSFFLFLYAVWNFYIMVTAGETIMDYEKSLRIESFTGGVVDTEMEFGIY